MRSNKVEDAQSLIIKKRGHDKAINPSSVVYQIWEGVIALVSLYSTLAVTFRISFQENITLRRLLITADVLYFAHIIIKFYVGYIQEGTLITNRKSIRNKYLSREFCFDILSALPLDAAELFFGSKPSYQWHIFQKYEGLRRILRFHSVTTFFGKYEDHLGLSTKSIRSFKYFLIAYTLIHCISCGWYMLACPNESEVDVFKCYDNGWAVLREQDMESITTLQRYVKCLYWATITATSTGYGDIHAVNESEKWYSVVSMLVGIGFFFGPILGYMASNLTNSDSKRARYTHRMGVIKEHLRDKSVSNEIQGKVIDYYEHLWTRHQGIVKKDMFSELPLTFQAELSLILNKHVLEKAPLFKNVSVEFMRMLSLVIKPATYLPKQIIFGKNDIRSTLFYIKRGSVEVLLNDTDTKPVKILKEGSFFGEVSLLLNIPRCASVRTQSYCELLMLERADLTKILKHFPEVSQKLYEVIERRCLEATAHIKKKEKNPDGLREKRFTIDKTIIKLTDFTEETELKKFGFVNRSQPIVFARKGFVQVWNIIVTFIVIVYAFIHTYIASYETSFGRGGYGGNEMLKVLFGLLYIIDLLYAFDMFVQARTTVETDKGDLIEEPKELWNMYVKTTIMWLDLVCVFPFEIFCFVYSGSYDRWVAATLLRSNRMFKMYKVMKLLNGLEHNININIVHLRCAKLLFLILSVTHMCACVWYIQACFGKRCVANSWADMHKADTSSFEIYVQTLYWAAATMTSTGYGDITAKTTRGEFIVLFVLIIGLLIYGYCLSNIAATLTNKLSPKVEFMERINGVVIFMTEQNLNQELIQRVNRYLGLVWRVHKGEAVPGSQLLMNDMPTRLQQEVTYEEMSEIIMKVPIFMNTDASFIKKLSAKLISYVFMPGDTIVYSGDVGREMYIMRRGLVEVLSKNKEKVVATLGPGGYFGEVGLIFGESRTADVRAKTYCEVTMLKKSDLDEVLVDFPLIERQLQMTSENRTVLQKIKNAAKAAGAPRKPNRIDLIERNRKLRSKSIFRRLSTNNEKRTEEESNVNEEMNREFNEPYQKLHPVAFVLSHFLLRSTIDPHGIFFRSWTCISVGFSCMYFFTLGLQFAFLQEDIVIWIINYLFDVFFFVDMYLKLHVCFYNNDGVLVTHPTATAKHYLKTNFIIDFLACMPLDLIILGTGNPVAYNYSKLNRVFHMLRVSQYFSYLDEPIGGNSTLFRNIKFGIYMFLLTHIFACAWFINGCPYYDKYTSDNQGEISTSHTHEKSLYPHENDSSVHGYCAKHSWAVENGRNMVSEDTTRLLLTKKMHGTLILLQLCTDCCLESTCRSSHQEVFCKKGSESVFTQYITSLYWAAATTCSVGYGDIHAYVVREMVLAVICMIVGVVFYGYVIASAAASLANADAQRARYQQKLNTINRFLKEQNVQPDMKKRVLEFYEFLWRRNKGADLENLFQGLPISLQADITLSLYKDIIESVPLFQGTELGFTKMLSLYIQPLLVPKGEYIVRKGDIGEEMFFINKGIVEVVSEHENPIIFDTMEPGRFFGEISTIFSCPRTASIRTQTNADVFVLKKKHLDVVLSHYPQIRKQIIETAEERQRLVRERAEAAARKKKEEEERKKQEELERQKNLKELDSADGESTKKEGTVSDSKNGNEGGSSNQEDSELQETSRDVRYVLFETLLTPLKQLKASLHDEFVIDLDSRFHMVFTFNCLLIFVTFITTTYMASFQSHPSGLVAFNIVAEVCFYLEIYFKFHVAYISSSGDKVTSVNEITKHYKKGRFRFDAVANFPIQLFCFVASPSARLQVYSYLNLLHILRLKNLNDFFSSWLKKLNTNVLMLRLLHNLVQILLTLQTFSCIWYGIACPGDQCEGKSWATHREGNSFTPNQNYCDSVYWALATMTSTGYGDIHATNNLEKVFAVIVMVWGKLIFGFVLGSVASTMANVEALRVKFEERFFAVQAHMNDQNMPCNLQQRVVNFFQYIWRRNRGCSNDAIFNDLPPCLHGELCLDLTGNLMNHVPLFTNCEVPFIRALCKQTQLVQFHEGEYITRKGDIGHEMYFIKRGQVIVEHPDGKSDLLLYDGDYFGDESMVISKARKITTRALTHVDMFCLRNSDLEEAFMSYPEEKKRVEENLGLE